MSQSLPKTIKFTYSPAASINSNNSHSSPKRKKIFAEEEPPRQLSPFKIIESKMAKQELSEQIAITMEKINLKLQRMQDLEQQNQLLKLENKQLKGTASPKVGANNQSHQYGQLQIKLLDALEIVDKTKIILQNIKSVRSTSCHQDLQQLYDLFKL